MLVQVGSRIDWLLLDAHTQNPMYPCANTDFEVLDSFIKALAELPTPKEDRSTY